MANMGGPKAHRSGQKAHQTPPEGLELEGGVAPSNSSHIYDNIGVPSFNSHWLTDCVSLPNELGT